MTAFTQTFTDVRGLTDVADRVTDYSRSFADPVLAGPAFVVASSGGGGTVPIPAGAVAGDLAVISASSGSPGMGSVTGWNTIYNGPLVPSAIDFGSFFWKRLTSSDIGGSAVVPGAQLYNIAVYRDVADPVVELVSDQSTTNTVTLSALSGLGSGLVVRAIADVEGSSSSTGVPVFPTSTTRTSIGASWWGGGIADQPVASDGTVAAEVVTTGGTATLMRGVQLFLAPSAPGLVNSVTFNTTDDLGLVDTPGFRVPRNYAGTAVRAPRTATVSATADMPNISGDFTFTVLASGTDGAPTLPPATPSAPLTLGRWQYEDPVTSAIYQFTVNPRTQGSPIAPPVLTEKQTTTGAPVTSEGMAKAVSMVLTGFCLTEAQYDDLLTWADKPYRVFLTDDLGRQFVVYTQAFQPVYDKSHPNNDWYCTYTLRLLVFGRAS